MGPMQSYRGWTIMIKGLDRRLHGKQRHAVYLQAPRGGCINTVIEADPASCLAWAQQRIDSSVGTD